MPDGKTLHLYASLRRLWVPCSLGAMLTLRFYTVKAEHEHAAASKIFTGL